MSQEFEQREVYNRLPGLPRPDPYRNVPSRLNNMPGQTGVGDSLPATLTRPFGARCTMSVMGIIGTGNRDRILGQEFSRCFMEIQNNSDTVLKITFGSGGGDYSIQPLATWWVPVCPINELFITQALGAQCTVMTGYDLV